MEPWMWILLFIGILVIAATVFVVAAGMLSSRLSRQDEEIDGIGEDNESSV